MLYDNYRQLERYPKRKYSSHGGSVVVQNAVEEALLGPGWSDTEPPKPPLKAGPPRPPIRESK